MANKKSDSVAQGMFRFRDPLEERIRLLSVKEIFEEADATLLEKLQEDRRIERKPSGTHGEYLTDYICMWANTSPEGGLIAVGMEDDGTLVGFSVQTQEHINRLE